jgi:hypothetical protein
MCSAGISEDANFTPPPAVSDSPDKPKAAPLSAATVNATLKIPFTPRHFDINHARLFSLPDNPKVISP